MFGWFNAGKAEMFGRELAAYFIGKMAPGEKLNESKLSSKTQYVLDKMSGRIERFKREESLNAYRTAKLANTFKWKLTDAGYDKEYVEKLTHWLLTRL